MVVRGLFVGVRDRARRLIDIFTTDRRFEAVALVDDDASICEAAIDANGWQRLPCFDDLDEALRTVPADAVFVVGDKEARPLHVRRALKMGRHVFVANPIAPSLDAAGDLVDFAERQEVTVVVDAPQRYAATERTLTGWAREQRHGLLQAVSLRRPADGRTPWEGSAGDLSLLLPVLGWNVSKVRDAVWQPGVVGGLLELGDGRTCRYHAMATNEPAELRFNFERATVRAISDGQGGKRLELAQQPGRSFEPIDIRDEDDPDPGERFSKESLYRAVTQRVRVADDGREHLLALAVADALQRCAQTGEPVTPRKPSSSTGS